MEGHEFYQVGGGEEEAALHRHYPANQLLIRRVARLYRMAQFTVVALLLLLVFGAATLLITVGIGGRCHVSPDGEAKVSADSHSADANIQQQTGGSKANADVQTPSAMLIAHRGDQTDGKSLQWETLHSEGGFHNSNRDLVVPREGYYRVFLQITYQSKEEEHCPALDMKLTNKVFCFMDSYPDDRILLASYDTMKCSKELYSTKSLYTSGIFKLDANARLNVTATYPEFFSKNHYDTFFGAEYLP